VKPQLDARGVKLLLVSIGTWEKSKVFCERTGFPAEYLYVDPESATHEALGLTKGVGRTFFNIQTPLAIKKRMDEGRTGDLKTVLSKWKAWNPPRMDQALQQGGMFVFDGDQCLFSHFDQSSGDHADLQSVLGTALAGFG
jgi:peroxiredoxin